MGGGMVSTACEHFLSENVKPYDTLAPDASILQESDR
jgi:hypothetical protein